MTIPEQQQLSAQLQKIIDDRRNKETAGQVVSSIFNPPQQNNQDVVAALTPILQQIAQSNRLSPSEIQQIVNGINIKMPEIKVPEARVSVKTTPPPPMEVRIPKIEVPRTSPLPDYDSGTVEYPSSRSEHWTLKLKGNTTAEVFIEYMDDDGTKLKSFSIRK